MRGGQQGAKQKARTEICTFRGKDGLSGDGAGESRLIINLKAQRLNSKGVGKVATLAEVRCPHSIGTLCFAMKLSSHHWFSDRNYMLETQFLFETQWFVTLFCTENQGGVHDSFCDGQHVRNLISVQK